jgi:hypothetical protein
MGPLNPIHFTPEKTSEWASVFAAGNPCKHIVIDGFLNEETANLLHGHFPPMDALKVRRKSLNENKAEDYKFDEWHPAFREVREAIRSDFFAEWMSTVTGISGLLTPDNPLGSGVHQGANGSYVDVHIDVNYDPESNLWRRVNLLIYLNRHWEESYGGHLEIWDPLMRRAEKRISPAHNRAVIFLTDENSPHGYQTIHVPEGETRKSFYAYFFTPIQDGFRYSDSRFIARPNDSAWRKAATNVKEAIKIQSKRILKALGVKSLDFQDKNKY